MPGADTEQLRIRMGEMESVFAVRGDIQTWTPEILALIDEAFVKNFVQEDGEPVPSLFFPKSAATLNIFTTYCSDVDSVLKAHPSWAPPYAREYFSYYTVWQMRGWGFPMPLGTASVVGVLNQMCKKVKTGISEVSTSRPGDAHHASCFSDADGRDHDGR